MTDERLKELIPDCVGYPVRTRKQTENYRKAVKALIEDRKRFWDNLCNYRSKGTDFGKYKARENLREVRRVESIIEQITGIPYNEIGE